MSHDLILSQLFPLQDLAGVFVSDIIIEGAALDVVEDTIQRLLVEMFPFTSNDLLACWERVLATSPATDATRSDRVGEILFRLRSLGRLDRAYFIDIAQTIGFDITITELRPLMAGIMTAGSEVLAEHTQWIWQVSIDGGFTRSFQAGVSSAGSPISWYRNKQHLDDIFNELKPAHTLVIFV